MREFYLTYFDLTSGEKYFNPTKNYTSYFLTFNEGGCRIELMHRSDIADNTGKRGLIKGLAHFSITIGSKDAVNKLTERLRKDGYIIEGEPRTTGDGYHESVVLDPEGNYIEITE
jgi:lactoylglutathione lyase